MMKLPAFILSLSFCSPRIYLHCQTAYHRCPITGYVWTAGLNLLCQNLVFFFLFFFSLFCWYYIFSFLLLPSLQCASVSIILNNLSLNSLTDDAIRGHITIWMSLPRITSCQMCFKHHVHLYLPFNEGYSLPVDYHRSLYRGANSVNWWNFTVCVFVFFFPNIKIFFKCFPEKL